MTEWTEARLQRLEDELTPEGIAAALQERELFPEIDQLSDVRIATRMILNVLLHLRKQTKIPPTEKISAYQSDHQPPQRLLLG